MRVLIATLMLAVCAIAQKPAPIPSELTKLRAEYIKATEEYKFSLTKLIRVYEDNVTIAENRLSFSRDQLSKGEVSRAQVEENERQLAVAREKVAESRRQLDDADKQIASVLDEAKLAMEYNEAVKQRRRARKPKCTNWTLTTYQRKTSGSIVVGYKLVCEK